MTGLQKKNGSLKELRARLLFVLLGVVVFRFGIYVPIPYIDATQLSKLMSSQSMGHDGLLQMFNMFSGGALEKLSVFALGVMPYISASIVFQMLTAVVPRLIEIKKEGDSGQKKIIQYTRYTTLGFALIQSLGVAVYTFNQPGLVNVDSRLLFYFVAIISTTTGSIFLMWLGEQMTERGIGNGISLIIFSGIVANLPFKLNMIIAQANQGVISYFSVWMFLIVMLFVVAFVVFIERAQRRIVVNYARRQQGRKMFAPQSSHLPLKLNMAGVIPPIFASSILMVPGMLSNWFATSSSLFWLSWIGNALQPGSLMYSIIFAATIIFFCFFYTALVFNPKETAENLKKSGAFISGVRPGRQTAKYIDSVMSKLTLVGSIYITAICLLPIFIMNFFGHGLSFTFGGTSLLIVVVVIMDFMTKLQSYMMSTQYDSLLKKANFR